MFAKAVADPDLQIRGGGAVIETLRKGAPELKKIFSRPFRPQFGLKISGGEGGGGRPLRPLPWICH